MGEDHSHPQARKKLSREEIMKLEVEEIKKHRWIESEKKGYDIGSYVAALDWIEKYAVEFRKYWENYGEDDDAPSCP